MQNKWRIESLVQLIEGLNRAPSMYCNGRSFQHICCFLSGFSAAQFFMKAEQDVFGWDFQNWLYKKLNTTFDNMHWSGQIYNVLAKENEDEARRLLFEYLTEYVKELES